MDWSVWFSIRLTVHQVDDPPVRLVHLPPVELDVDGRDGQAETMPQRLRNRLLRDVQRSRQGRPRVARPIGRNALESRFPDFLSASAYPLHPAYLLQPQVHPVQEILVIRVRIQYVQQVIPLSGIPVDNLLSLRLNLHRIQPSCFRPLVLQPPVHHVLLFRPEQVRRVDSYQVEHQHEDVPVLLLIFLHGVIPQDSELFQRQAALPRLLRLDFEPPERVKARIFLVDAIVEHRPDVPQVD